ncbi:MAG: hypothetical protein J2P47_00550, partial [Acetobacteraceae bacterium]|nr:hypothetical protein [Acetobacteraceae bacterium]
GFLLNIIAGNVNRMLPRHAYWAVRPERSSFIPIGLMLGAFVVLGREVFPAAPRFRWTAVLQNIRALREAGPGTTCRAMALIYFALATGTLIFVLKSGSAFNYLLEWLSIGCALIGIFLIDLARWGAGYRNWFRGAVALLIVFIAHAPVRGGALSTSAHEIEQQAALVKRIAAAKKPVASDDMTLLMRAGKPVIFEPAIVTELAAMGRWDETPLVQMIRRCDFAFMITIAEARQIRSPAVDAEMRKAYPHVERIGILAVREPAPGSCEGSPRSDGAPAAR